MRCGLVEGTTDYGHGFPGLPSPSLRHPHSAIRQALFTSEAQSNRGWGGWGGYIKLWLASISSHTVKYQTAKSRTTWFSFLTNIKWLRSPWSRDKLCLDTPSTSRLWDDQRKWAVRLKTHVIQEYPHKEGMRMCVCVPVYMCVSVHMYCPEVDTRCLSLLLSPLSCEAGSHWTWHSLLLQH